MSEELEELRGRIDQIDQQMVELFKQRMEAVGEIADYKVARSLPVYAAAREETDFAAGCAALSRKVEAMGQAHGASWWNLF